MCFKTIVDNGKSYTGLYFSYEQSHNNTTGHPLRIKSTWSDASAVKLLKDNLKDASPLMPYESTLFP